MHNIEIQCRSLNFRVVSAYKLHFFESLNSRKSGRTYKVLVKSFVWF